MEILLTILLGIQQSNIVMAIQKVVRVISMSGRGYGLNRASYFCVKPGVTGAPAGFTKTGILTKEKQQLTGLKVFLMATLLSKKLCKNHMTTSQRDALIAVDGMVIYNTDLGCVQLFRGNNPGTDNSRRGWNCLTKGCNG